MRRILIEIQINDRLFPLEIEIAGEFLFSVGGGRIVDRIVKGLNKGRILDGLRTKFHANGSPLSAEASVTRRAANEWLITGDGRGFIIRRKDRTLNIYAGEKGWSIKDLKALFAEELELSPSDIQAAGISPPQLALQGRALAEVRGEEEQLRDVEKVVFHLLPPEDSEGTVFALIERMEALIDQGRGIERVLRPLKEWLSVGDDLQLPQGCWIEWEEGFTPEDAQELAFDTCRGKGPAPEEVIACFKISQWYAERYYCYEQLLDLINLYLTRKGEVWMCAKCLVSGLFGEEIDDLRIRLRQFLESVISNPPVFSSPEHEREHEELLKREYERLLEMGMV